MMDQDEVEENNVPLLKLENFYPDCRQTTMADDDTQGRPKVDEQR
jgi:hypothetical protein